MRLPTYFTFVAHNGFPPEYLRRSITPWTVFQDGSLKIIYSTSLTERRCDPRQVASAMVASSVSPTCARAQAITLQAATFLNRVCSRVNSCGAWVEGKSARAQATPKRLPFPLIFPSQSTNSQSFRVPNFRFYLTLSSKCFSSFLHSTYLLSVIWWYLALSGVYLTLRAQIPMNTTRKTSNTRRPP